MEWKVSMNVKSSSWNHQCHKEPLFLRVWLNIAQILVFALDVSWFSFIELNKTRGSFLLSKEASQQSPQHDSRERL